MAQAPGTRAVSRHFPTRRETVLEWYRVRLRLPDTMRDREVVEHAMRRGWSFFLPSSGEPIELTDVDRILAAPRRALFMVD